MFKNRRFFIWSTVALSVLPPTLAELYAPSFHSITAYFSVPANYLPISISIFFFAFSLGQLTFGPLSEMIGRRMPLITGLLITLLGTFMILYSKTFTWFFIGRFAQGFGIGAPTSLQKALLRDKFKGNLLSHSVGYVMILMMLAASFCPLIGSAIENFFSWKVHFYLLAVINLITLITTFLFIYETKEIETREPLSFKPIVENYKHLADNPFFLGCIICAALPPTATLSFYATAPFIYRTLLMQAPIVYGLWLTLPALGLLVGLLTHTPVLKKFGRHRTLRAGIHIQLLGAFVFLLMSYFFNTTLLLVLPFAIFSAGACWIQPNALATAMTPYPHIAGYASALYGATRMLFVSLNIALLSFFGYGHTSLPQSYVSALPLALSILGVSVLCFFLQFLLFEKTMHHFEED